MHKSFLKLWITIVTAVFGVLTGCGLYFVTKPVDTVPMSKWTIVIDAGHGGIDKGATGTETKVNESVLNLLYAKELKKLFNEVDINVVFTREDENGLYGDTSPGFKRRDMEKRKEIILEAEPVLVLSVHMNKCRVKERTGAVVFFNEANDLSVKLGKSIQKSLNILTKKATGAIYGDFYILKCTPYPSALVECGFLSNGEEERMLANEVYRKSLCESIFDGVMAYLSN